MAERLVLEQAIKPPKTPFKMEPVPVDPESQKGRGWKLTINGKEVLEPIETLQLTQERMGIVVEYGQRGYDRPTLKESGGGGSVTIPYLIKDGNLFVGVVSEARDLMGGVVWNVPRGFMDPNEEHFQTALREYKGETGHDVPDNRVVELAGDPTNPNSAFFDTSGVNEGVHFYAVEILESELELIDVDSQHPQYAFNQNVLRPISKTGEKIMKTTFIPVGIAMQLADQFTVAGAGRLFFQLATTGKLDPKASQK